MRRKFVGTVELVESACYFPRASINAASVQYELRNNDLILRDYGQEHRDLHRPLFSVTGLGQDAVVSVVTPLCASPDKKTFQVLLERVFGEQMSFA